MFDLNKTFRSISISGNSFWLVGGFLYGKREKDFFILGFYQEKDQSTVDLDITGLYLMKPVSQEVLIPVGIFPQRFQRSFLSISGGELFRCGRVSKKLTETELSNRIPNNTYSLWVSAVEEATKKEEWEQAKNIIFSVEKWSADTLFAVPEDIWIKLEDNCPEVKSLNRGFV